MLKLVKNKQLSHQDQKGNALSIYSLDFQSNGSRLASGGGDCVVKIWDIHSLYLSDQSESALVATLHNHTKSVNCVRWSRTGGYLASGSDDCYILIYTLEISRQPPPLGFNTIANKENWTRSLTLQGHEMDVLDLDWTPSGLLASASIDNSILIWDVYTAIQSSLRVATPSRRLQGHSSFVKGVAFDPFGIFLASASADNTVIIWNCENWTIERKLDEPLRDSRDTSIFRRLSWAPDGGSLCVSCATKGGKPIGMILKRDVWTSVADLVGHDTPTICCRFNPVPLRVPTANSDILAACCIALGDQSGVISVWTTTQNSPIFVIDNMLTGPVLDLSWFAAGETEMLLAACSMDGSISLFNLTGAQIIGGDRRLTTQEFESHLKMIYGRGEKELSSHSPTLLEDPSVARFRDISQTKIDQTPMRKGEEQTHPRFQQTVIRFKNGKKRIQPAVSESGALVGGSILETPSAPAIRYSDVPPAASSQMHPPLACTLSHMIPCPGISDVENFCVSCRVKMRDSHLNIPHTQQEISLIASDVSPPKALDPALSMVTLRTFSKLQANTVWDCYISGRVSTMSGAEICISDESGKFEGIGVVGTFEGCLILFSLSSGLKLFSPLILGGKILSVDVHYKRETELVHIFSLNSEGDVWLMTYSWKSGLQLQSKTSIRPLLSFLGISHQNPEIHTAFLSTDGDVIVSINSPISGIRGQESLHHFQFLPELQSWRNIASLKSFLEKNKFPPSEDHIKCQPAASLDDIISRSLRPPAGLHSDKAFYRKLALSTIEDNLVLSISQKSLDSIRFWLSKWTVQCCQCGLESKVKLLVSHFLECSAACDCTSADIGNPAWILDMKPVLCGIEKSRLVREDILPALASTGMYQSLVAEFSDALDLVTYN